MSEPPSSNAEESFSAVPYYQLLPDLRKRRRGPLGRLLLWLSGADRRLLKYVPIEDRSFTVVGSAVLFTAVVAGLLSFTTIGFFLYGSPVYSTTTLVGGIAGGLGILSLDRILVKAQLNPFVFPPEVLAALWNPMADATWFDILARSMVRRGLRLRAAETLRVVRRSFIRLVIAFCTSYLFSQAALFYFFSGEIDSQARYIVNSERSAASSRATIEHGAQKKSLQAQIDSYDGSTDPKVRTLTAQAKAIAGTINALESDAATVAQLVAAEFDGPPIQCFKFLSTFAPPSKCTSGKRGDGDQYQAALALQRRVNGADSSAHTRFKTVRTALKMREKVVTGGYDVRKLVADLQARIRKLDIDYGSRIVPQLGPNERVTGILIRHQALSALEDDTDPSTPQIDKPKPCSYGVSGWACHVARWFVEPTPLGSYVGALKILFLAIEMLPILLKVTFSLRTRRPYDQLEAAVEEILNAASVEMLDNQLIQVGARLESRASWRKAQRSASGAEFILGTPAPEDFGNFLGADPTKRRRVWPRMRNSG